MHRHTWCHLTNSCVCRDCYPVLFPPKAKLMAPSNVLPQTGGATQPAPSTQHTSDSATIMDVPVEMEQIKRHCGTIRSNFRLYFSEAGAQMHGPFFFAPDQRAEQIHQWLQEYTFYSRCEFDKETNQARRVLILMLKTTEAACFSALHLL